MATKFLILFGLLGAFWQAAGDCELGYFQCKDGSECVWGSGRCDGFRDCGDGSDEDACDVLNAVALPVNASVTLRVQYATVHGSIDLLLCGSRHCSRVLLVGESTDGTLRYQTYTRCDLFGKGGRVQKDNWVLFRPFPPGEVVLELQHQPGQLTVWRQGRPDYVVEVPVEADYGTLRARPENWATDMPVQFTGAVGAAALQRAVDQSTARSNL